MKDCEENILSTTSGRDFHPTRGWNGTRTSRVTRQDRKEGMISTLLVRQRENRLLVFHIVLVVVSVAATSRTMTRSSFTISLSETSTSSSTLPGTNRLVAMSIPASYSVDWREVGWWATTSHCVDEILHSLYHNLLIESIVRTRQFNMEDIMHFLRPKVQVYWSLLAWFTDATKIRLLKRIAGLKSVLHVIS